MSETAQLEKYLTRLHNSLPFFLTQLWQAVGLPGIAQHQLDMADWLQNGPSRRGVRAFRGASKTWVTIGFCLFRLFRNPQAERVTVISKSLQHSKDSLYLARRWIGVVPFLQHLEPRVGNRSIGQESQRDSATMFDVGPASFDRTPSFAAYGIGGQITGSRSTLIVSDDVETPENTLTQDMRVRLRDSVTEYENMIIPGGDIVYLGTDHHEESLYITLGEAGYEFRAWPERYPDLGGVLPPDLAPIVRQRVENGEKQPGDPMWPDRFDDHDLIGREAAEGKSKFAMQFKLLRGLDDALRYPLKLADLTVFPVQRDKAPISVMWGTRDHVAASTRIEDIPCLGFRGDGLYRPVMFDKQWEPYTSTKMWIDPSGKGEDKTGVAVVSHLNGFLWCPYCQGLPGGYGPDALQALAATAQAWRVSEVYLEDNFGQGMLEPLLRPVLERLFVRAEDAGPERPAWSCSIETVRASTQKEIRIIEALEPVMNQHRLVIAPDVIENQDLQRQMTRITRQRDCLPHEDELEALAMCVWAWQDILHVDPNISAERSRASEIERELEDFRRLAGAPSQEPSWVSHEVFVR